MKSISVVCEPYKHTGWGRIGVWCVEHLIKNGWQVFIKPTKPVVEDWLPELFKGLIADPPADARWELIIGPLSVPPDNRKRTIYYTCYEATRLPPLAVKFLNDCDAVLTTSNWNATCFSAAGVEKPIYVVPPKINPIFKPAAPDNGGRYIFGCAANLTHGAQRKGIEQIIKAFQFAFPLKIYSPDLRGSPQLQVKIWPSGVLNKKAFDDKRIVFIEEMLTDEQLRNWYWGLDAFISVATGGYEMMAAEALACGRPVIGIFYGGQADYLCEFNAISIPYELEPAGEIWAGNGLWAKAKTKDIASAIRQYMVVQPMFAGLRQNDSDKRLAEALEKIFGYQNHKYAIQVARWQARQFYLGELRKYAPNGLNDITVVITTCRRPDKLTAAFNSCRAAGVRNLVVTASAVDAQTQAVLDWIKREMPAAIITAISDDKGNNEAWLRGVEAAQTKWVMLLHDDDCLLPAWRSLDFHLDDKAGFYLWGFTKHGLVNDKTSAAILNSRPGFYHSDCLWPFLLTPGNLTLSPGLGLFRRDFLIETLKEAAENLNKPQFMSRPTMMVGNDLLIWLRAAERYRQFYYINDALVSFGDWAGSETASHEYSGQLDRLIEFYKHTRDYYLKAEGAELLNDCVIVLPAHIDETNERRVKFALAEWGKVSKLTGWPIQYVEDRQFERVFETPNSRVLFYLKDVFDWFFEATKHQKTLIFGNNDNAPVLSIGNHISMYLPKHGALYFWKRDYPMPFDELDERLVRTSTRVSAGVDLVAITPAWWAANRDRYPDMLYGTECWDYIIRLLIDETGGKGLQWLIYHEAHQMEVSLPETKPHREHNRALAKKFLLERGINPYWEDKSMAEKLAPR